MLIDNYHQILNRIQKVCAEVNRDPSSVHLVVVSKTRPVTEIITLYEAGVRDFGENKVQELMDKVNDCPPDIRWHLIGSLQTNKVKYIAPFIHLIHSVDRPELAREIHKHAIKADRTIPVLLQIRVALEDTKHGCIPADVPDLTKQITALPNLRLGGFMTMTSLTDDQEQLVNEYARFFAAVPDQYRRVTGTIFSAGMTGDFEHAIRSGSTMVRIGSAIFGNRN